MHNASIDHEELVPSGPPRIKELRALLLKLTSHKFIGTCFHASDKYEGANGYIVECTDELVFFERDGIGWESSSDRISPYTAFVNYRCIHDPEEFDTYRLQYDPEWYGDGGWRAIWTYTHPDCQPHDVISQTDQDTGLTMDELLHWLGDGKEFVRPVTKLVEVSA
jgi:hypothetical protein